MAGQKPYEGDFGGGSSDNKPSKPDKPADKQKPDKYTPDTDEYPTNNLGLTLRPSPPSSPNLGVTLRDTPPVSNNLGLSLRDNALNKRDNSDDSTSIRMGSRQPSSDANNPNSSTPKMLDDKVKQLLTGAQDGHLTLDEAKAWYQHGGGKDLTVNQGRLKVGYLLKKDGTLDRAWVEGEDLLVHGQVDLNLKTMRIYDAPYDFELHPNRSPIDLVRNILTKVGQIYHGDGVPYMIRYKGGNPTVKKFP